VFLSYASQDAEAVARLAAALCGAGIEVWFDQDELVGGDAWDAKIRRQIAECALFVPVISAATQARLEGYFRIEWKLAAQRTHAMAEEKAFLLPVVIDATRDAEAHVPDEFRDVQWTRLPEGEAVEKFCGRVKQLLEGEDGARAVPGVGKQLDRAQEEERGRRGEERRGRATPPLRKRPLVLAVVFATVVAVGAAWWFGQKPPGSAAAADSAKPVGSVASPSVVPGVDEKSLAVLPFANLSGDKDQEYFSDGLTEEILKSLMRERDLRVPGPTSSFSFKGKNASTTEIAKALNVSRLVEGSVQRSGTKVRIRVSLTRVADNASEDLGTFTEEFADIFTLYDKVARAVVEKLMHRQLTSRVEVLTKNPDAYDLYLKANKVFFRGDIGGFKEAIELAGAAAKLDPGYVNAAFTVAAAHCNIVNQIRGSSDLKSLIHHATEARHWAEAVAQLDPHGSGPSAMAIYRATVERDNPRALEQADLAIQARPNDVAANTFRAWSLVGLGRVAEAMESFRVATTSDPLNPFCLGNEAWAATFLRRPREAAAVIKRAEVGQANAGALRDCQFLLTGELPATISGFNSSARALWLWRSRRFAELEKFASTQVPRADSSAERFSWWRWQHDALRCLGRTVEAEAAAQELVALAQEFEESPDYGPPQKMGRLAIAMVRTGKAKEGIAAGTRYVEAADAKKHVAERWRRETELAELYAYLRMPTECVHLLAALLRVPSGVTVPSLQVSPSWDNVRGDPAFKALVADPKNSAPL